MLINILAVIVPILIVFVYISNKYSKKENIEEVKCGCGKSQSGLCDGSHTE
jgi:CDGSH-type Zn-finger protein